MSLAELRIAIGVPEAALLAALRLLQLGEQPRTAFTTAQRVTLAPAWRRRCAGERRVQ